MYIFLTFLQYILKSITNMVIPASQKFRPEFIRFLFRDIVNVNSPFYDSTGKRVPEGFDESSTGLIWLHANIWASRVLNFISLGAAIAISLGAYSKA